MATVVSSPAQKARQRNLPRSAEGKQALAEEAERRQNMVLAALRLLAAGYSQNAAAEILGVAAGTLSRYRRAYAVKGLAGLMPKRPKPQRCLVDRISALASELKTELDPHFLQGVSIASLEDAQRRLRIVRTLQRHLENGLSLNKASRRVGVSPSTASRWIQLAETGECWRMIPNHWAKGRGGARSVNRIARLACDLDLALSAYESTPQGNDDLRITNAREVLAPLMQYFTSLRLNHKAARKGGKRA